MCRAHGIPHQRVTGAADLQAALRSAWSCNRHSVVEVVTSRTSNVQRHREVQAAVLAAVERALALLQPAPAQQAASAAGDPTAAAAAVTPAAAQPFECAVLSASCHAFRLPLARPLTTGADGGSRRSFLLRVSLGGPGGRVVHGVGEVAPLPGLHAETAEQAEAQLALLCQLLGGGARLPLTAALLGGRLGAWLEAGLGVPPVALLPSVRCGLEAALLSALAQVSVVGAGCGEGVVAACASHAILGYAQPAMKLSSVPGSPPLPPPCSTRARLWPRCWRAPPRCLPPRPSTAC